MKNNKGVVISLCTVIIVLIGTITYMFASGTVAFKTSNKNINNNQNTKNEENKNTVVKKEEDSKEDKNNNEESSKECIEIEESSKISVLDFYFDSVAIVSEGQVYVNVYGSTPDVDRLFGEGVYQKLAATRQTYEKYSFDNFEYIKDDNNEFTGMKLNTSNVENVYAYNYGQVMSTNYGLILLNKDKTLSIVSLYSLIIGNKDVKKISELSDIEKVITEDDGGWVTYAIKSNGEKINLSNYIPKDYKQF